MLQGSDSPKSWKKPNLSHLKIEFVFNNADSLAAKLVAGLPALVQSIELIDELKDFFVSFIAEFSNSESLPKSSLGSLFNTTVVHYSKARVGKLRTSRPFRMFLMSLLNSSCFTSFQERDPTLSQNLKAYDSALETLIVIN